MKEKLGDQFEVEKKKTRKEKAGVDIDREKELLQTIERIKGKLRRSITKKMQEERVRQYEFIGKLSNTNFQFLELEKLKKKLLFKALEEIILDMEIIIKIS